MTRYTVAFGPEARDQLLALHQYLVEQASVKTADRFTEAVVAFCEKLATFPDRGVSRDDVRPGLKTTHYQGRTIIAYAVDEIERQVLIVGIFYGGQDYETSLSKDEDA